MPSDIDPHSGMRLPLPRREDLDEWLDSFPVVTSTAQANLAKTR